MEEICTKDLQSDDAGHDILSQRLWSAELSDLDGKKKESVHGSM